MITKTTVESIITDITNASKVIRSFFVKRSLHESLSAGKLFNVKKCIDKMYKLGYDSNDVWYEIFQGIKPSLWRANIYFIHEIFVYILNTYVHKNPSRLHESYGSVFYTFYSMSAEYSYHYYMDKNAAMLWTNLFKEAIISYESKAEKKYRYNTNPLLWFMFQFQNNTEDLEVRNAFKYLISICAENQINWNINLPAYSQYEYIVKNEVSPIEYAVSINNTFFITELIKHGADIFLIAKGKVKEARERGLKTLLYDKFPASYKFRDRILSAVEEYKVSNKK